MSTKIQTEKNLKLSQKLAAYLVNHPDASGKLPADASFVTFSAGDNALNKTNSKLIEELIDEGKNVVKAEETNNSKMPWRFTAIAS